jgi:hypothetical protein
MKTTAGVAKELGVSWYEVFKAIRRARHTGRLVLSGRGRDSELVWDPRDGTDFQLTARGVEIVKGIIAEGRK